MDLLQSEYLVAKTNGLVLFSRVCFGLYRLSFLCSNLTLSIISWIRLLRYPLLIILFFSVLVIDLNVSFLVLVLRYLMVSPLVIYTFFAT